MLTRGGLGMLTLFGGTQEIAKCILSLSLKAFLERIEQGGGRGLAIPEKRG